MPESGPWGLSEAGPAARSLTPNGCLSVTVLALQRGGQCQGLGGDPVPARASGLPSRRLRRQALEAPPFTLTPLPRALGEESTHCCTAEIVKLNFPDVQAPGARACCLERKWGLGKAAPYFLPAHPAFPVPPRTAGAVNHSRPASQPMALSPSPQVACQPPAFGPQGHASSEWAAPGAEAGARGGMAGA